jgi:hypothetical protein
MKQSYLYLNAQYNEFRLAIIQLEKCSMQFQNKWMNNSNQQNGEHFLKMSNQMQNYIKIYICGSISSPL